nr:MAG TPA: hypothetical protein [Caudoviricetes sp.]
MCCLFIRYLSLGCRLGCLFIRYLSFGCVFPS